MSDEKKGTYIELDLPFPECKKCIKMEPEVRKVIDNPFPKVDAFNLDLKRMFPDFDGMVKETGFHLVLSCENGDLCRNLRKLFSHE